MENQQGDSRCFNMLNGNSHSGTACFETRCVVSNEPDSNEISVAVKVGGSWATCLPDQKVVGERTKRASFEKDENASQRAKRVSHN